MKENNNLSAQDWLDKEKIVGVWRSVSSPSISTILERYANYKSQILLAKILYFRLKIPIYADLTIRDKYDRHFEIEIARKGEINNEDLRLYPLTPKDCFQKGSDFDIDPKKLYKDFLSIDSEFRPGFKNPTKSPDDWVQEMDKKLFESFKYQEAMSLGNATKDEYTILKEKCIALECKRVRRDKLKAYHLFILSGVAGFFEATDGMLKDKESCLKFSITRMKEYIDKVEKELKEKELKEKEGFKFESIPPRKEKIYTEKDIDRLKSIIIETWMVIDGKGVKIGDCFKNWDFVDIIDGKVILKKELKEKPVDGFINCTNATTSGNNFNVYRNNNETINVAFKLDLKTKKEILYQDGIALQEKDLNADEIFERYKDVLTKEQIKELYKN